MRPRCFCAVIVIAVFNIFVGRAQTVSQIKASSEYLWGEGRAETIAEADNFALAALISQINIAVSSAFDFEESVVISDKELASASESRTKVNTYSSATLTAACRVIESDEPEAVVLRYIKKSELDRIFAARADKAVEFVRLAENALKKAQIDDALKYYYWGLSLVNSLMRPNEAKAVVEIDGKEHEVSLIAFLPTRIEQIFSGIRISAEKVGNDTYRLFSTYNDIPVRSMDYTYFDGLDYSVIHSFLDGEGLLELRPNFIADFVTVKIEYEFRKRANVDDEVKEVLEAQRKRNFANSSIKVSLKKAEGVPVILKEVVPKVLAIKKDSENYVDDVLNIAKSIRELKPDVSRQYFSVTGWNDFSKILSYGKILVGENQKITCYEDNEGVVCRGLSCNCKFGKSQVFNENLSFVFDQEGKISHVALGLGKMTTEDIMKKARWGEASRKRIVSFLEDYRTAYALKDIDYLEKVFDNNALIIVGNVLKTAPEITDKAFNDGRYIKFTRYTKREFLSRLKDSFRSKEYINLHFSGMDIKKLKGNEMYGIQLKQDYYSSNYGDTGYLFLMVDLADPQRPVIYVRTWQPEPDAEYGILGAENFDYD